MPEATAVLSIDGLTLDLHDGAHVTRLVDSVSISIGRGTTVALVGESGCGKSVTALSILRLLPGAIRPCAGRIDFDGRDLVTLSPGELRRIRGARIGMIFQEPMSSLNPVVSVGRQIVESLELHRGLHGAAARRRAIELLRQVRIPAAEERFDEYPHQLSGGMRQRVMIAMALACEPALLIADEPTTALDVTVQAQIVELIAELQRSMGLAVLFITHDLALVSGAAAELYVMYSGRIVEHGPTRQVLAAPRHPYTQALLRSLPSVDARGGVRGELPVIAGDVPRPHRRPGGCAFHPRCGLGSEDVQCRTTTPELRVVADSQSCACWKA